MKMNKRLFVISLGQGQGPLAENMFNNAVADGSWVFFQVFFPKYNYNTSRVCDCIFCMYMHVMISILYIVIQVVYSR